ncbi:MAG: ABC transporter substrate-binding protein [Candidatus Rokubacteria bacterium]|nr:ABC transporter substrate-binding protein [Candidatus Rokubacteria bacterium]
MERRAFLAGSTLALLAAPRAARAQPAGKARHIGFLSSGFATAGADLRQAVVDGLADFGYREGQNAIFHDRYAEGRFERLPALAAELVRLRVDVIITQTTSAALAAKRATPTVPIVAVAASDLVGTGVVASLARPGGNVTGLSFLGTEVAVKQMQLLKEITPAATRLAFLASRAFEAPSVTFRELERAAPALGVSVRFVETTLRPDYPAVFAAMARDGVTGLVVASGLFNNPAWGRIVELAARDRLPAIYAARPWVEAGGLASYGYNRAEFTRQAGRYVDRIFKGAKPADLPIEQPTKFELVLNQKTAQALGLTLPQGLLLRADEVLQ